MKLLILLIGLLSTVASFAETPNGFPNLFYRNNINSIENVVLDRVCFSLRSRSIGYQCNPAFLADNEEKNLNISAIVTDSISTVAEYADEANHSDSIGIIRKGLDESEPIFSQASVSAWYRQDWWELTFTPARLGLASDVRNPALPEMTTFVSIEREIQWRFGFFAFNDKNFHVGANIRLVDAKFFDDRFEVLTASVGTQTFEVKEGQTLFIEPSLAYTFDGPWDPTVTATLTDVAVWSREDEVPTNPLLELGYATTPEFLEKKLTSAVHLTIGDDFGSLKSRFGWGGVYHISDKLGLSALLADNRYGFGAEGSIDSLVLGLGFKSEEIDFGGFKKERVEQLLFRVGLIF